MLLRNGGEAFRGGRSSAPRRSWLTTGAALSHPTMSHSTSRCLEDMAKSDDSLILKEIMVSIAVFSLQ